MNASVETRRKSKAVFADDAKRHPRPPKLSPIPPDADDLTPEARSNSPMDNIPNEVKRKMSVNPQTIMSSSSSLLTPQDSIRGDLTSLSQGGVLGREVRDGSRLESCA